MLKHTRKLINETINDFRSIRTFFSYATQVIYIIYLIYLLITPNAIWYIHLTLLVISIPFFIYDIISTNNINRIRKEKPRFWRFFKKRKYKKVISDAKKSKAKIGRIKFYTSHVLKLIVLATAFYPIIVSPDSVHPLSIIGTTIMAIIWLLYLVLEVLILIIEKRCEMFKEALSTDVEFITKPVNAVKNTFKRIIGEDGEKEGKTTEKHSENITDWLETRISKFKYKSKSEANEKPHIVISNNERDSNEF